MVETEATYRLSPRLREARLAHSEKPSQGLLAKRACAQGQHALKAAVISRIELGYRDASWPEVVALADALGVDPDWLAGKPPGREAQPSARAEAPAKPVPDASTPPQEDDPKPAEPAPVVDPRMPPTAPPFEGQPNVHLRRSILSRELDRANAAIADRSLPPAIWRAWRAYLDTVRAALQATNAF